jgi:hypothetical protein
MRPLRIQSQVIVFNVLDEFTPRNSNTKETTMSPLQFQSRFLRSAIRPLTALIFACFMLGVPGHAWAAEFWAIAANVTGAKNPEAHLELGLDTLNARGGTDIFFNVYDVNGVQIAEFTLQTNANGLVSSASAAPPNDNLFAISLGRPVLVRALSPNGATGNDYAALRQTLGRVAILVGTPPIYDTLGSFYAEGNLFPVVLGDFAGAALLVANLSSADISVDVFLGTKGPDGTGKYRIPRLKSGSMGIVQITDPADAHSHLSVTSTGNMVVQLVIDTGKQIHEVTVLPAR